MTQPTASELADLISRLDLDATEMADVANAFNLRQDPPGYFRYLGDVARDLQRALSALIQVELMKGALEERDAGLKGLPCQTGKPIGDVCLHCGATADGPCHRTVRADSKFVSIARQSLSGEA